MFLYNPFGEEVVAKVVAAIESVLAGERRSVFVVYYNPVFGAAFDASRSLNRYFAARLPYAQDERRYAPDADDSVVIWQGGRTVPAHARADARIHVVTPGMRAEVDDGVDLRAT